MRRRAWLLIGIVVIVVAVFVTARLLPGDKPLKQAAEKLQDQSVHLRVKYEDERTTSTSDIVTEADGLSGRMTTTSTPPGESRRTEEQLFQPGEVWTRAHGQGIRALPDGKQWLHQGDFDDMAVVPAPIDYARMLALATDIEKIGDGDYQATVDMRAVTRAATGERRTSLQAMFSPRIRRTPIEVGVDDDGNPTRIAYKARGAGGGEYSMTVDFLRVGAAATVEPPPAETVIEDYELMEARS